MDLKLTEEQKLIKETAARFVDKELIGREGAYLKQREPFLPPGDPARRDLDAAVRQELTGQARRVGLWSLELPESLGGSAMSAIDRVLIHREFGRSVLPFRPISIPAFMFESQYGADLAAGKVTLSLAFDEAHKTGAFEGLQTLYRQEPDGLYFARFGYRYCRPTRRSLFISGAGTGDAALGIVCDRSRHAGSGHRR